MGRRKHQILQQEKDISMHVSLRRYWALLITYLKPQWLKVALLAFLLLSSIGLQLSNPLLLSYFIDIAQKRGDLDVLMRLACIFTGSVLLNQVVTALASYFSEDVGWTATNHLRTDLTLHCLNLDMSFHKAHTPGELIERVDGDVIAIATFFSKFVFRVLGNLILLFCILLVLFYEDWHAGLLLTIFTIVAIGALRRVQGIAVPHFRAMRQSSANLSSFTEERLSSLEDICSSGAKAYIMYRLYLLLRVLLEKTRKSNVMGRLFSSTLEVGLAIATAMVLTLGAYLLRIGQMSLGTIYLTFYYATLLSANLGDITQQINEMQSATASIQRITQLFNIQSLLQDGPGVDLPDGPLKVSFQNVTFGYTTTKQVLHNLSFQLEAGRTLGLLGRTGSGKTTLTRLLFRTYDPNSGVISLGGKDIRQMQLTNLRKRIGVVTQEVQLIHASVRDNLTFFDHDISDEQILRVLEELNLMEWYRALSNGLNTEIDSQGLSAGEAQLLAFTRVFLQNPDIIVLDEASSRLDPVTEKLIERATIKLLQDRTAIIIAHRLETLRRVDEIMILEDGRIGEYGPREQLSLNANSRFYSLLQTGAVEVLL